MASRYTDEAIEAIWAQLAGGVRPTEILRRLNAGEAGVPAPNPPMPERTFFDYLAKLKRTRGKPELAVTPGTEIDAATAIRCRALELFNRQIAEIEDRERAGTVKVADIQKLDKITRAVDDIRRRARADVSPPRKQHGSGEGGGTQKGSTPTLIADLSREPADQRRRTVSPPDAEPAQLDVRSRSNEGGRTPALSSSGYR